MNTIQWKFAAIVLCLSAVGLSAVATFAQEPKAAAPSKPDTPKVSDAEAKVAEELFQDGRKLFFQSKYLAAIVKLKEAAKANPAKTSYKLLLAKAHRAVKQDAAAVKVFEEIIAGNPEHVDAGIQLAELLTPQKKPTRVIAVLQPLLKLKHTYALYHLLAEAHYQKEELNKARKYYEEAIKLNPRNRDDHYQLGNIYLAQKRFAKAGQVYEFAGRLGFSSGVFHFKLAGVYFNLKKYTGKVTTAKVAGGKAGEINNDLYLIEAVPAQPDTFYVTGSGSAVFQIAKSRQLGIDIFEIRFLEANTWLAAHHYAKADAIYKQIEEQVSKQDTGLFWSQWSQTALGLDEYKNYLKRLQTAIDVEPKIYKATLSDALVAVARRYQQQGDNVHYIEFLQKAVESNPLSARLHLTLGDAYWAVRDRTKANQQYQLVLELEPEFAQRVRLLNRLRGQADSADVGPAVKTATVPTGKVTVLAGARCLLSGEPAVAEFTVDYKGGKVFFCCAGCRKEFAKNLATLSFKANHQMALTGQARAKTCALTGRKLNPKFKVTVAGAEVTLCCSGCKAKTLKAKGDDQIRLIFNNVAFAKHFQIVPATVGKRVPR